MTLEWFEIILLHRSMLGDHPQLFIFVTLRFSTFIIVPDLGSRIRDVVLVRSRFSSGKPQGVGILEWGGNGEGMEMGKLVYEQPGTKVDGILSRQGGYLSK
jgi:hypothetical protein